MNRQQVQNKIYRILFTSSELTWKSTLFYETEQHAAEVCALLDNALAGTYQVCVIEEPRLKLVNS